MQLLINNLSLGRVESQPDDRGAFGADNHYMIWHHHRFNIHKDPPTT